ncbi:MAG: response regulator [bacterium]
MTVIDTFLIDRMDEMVVMTDADGVCHHVNPAFCSIFSGRKENWINKKLKFNHPQKPISKKQQTTNLEKERFVTKKEKEGRVFWIEWQHTALPNQHSIYVGRDVSHLKEQEKRLTHTVRHAEEAGMAKMRFLATMSHEMRTPLNGILGMTGLLLDSGLDQNQTSYATAVRESGTALLTLINDILDYSKVEAGKLELDEVVFDPQSLVQSVAELLSPRATHKGLEIASYIDRSVPRRLVGDEARLRQVLLNLAGNGVKFTEQGGVFIELSSEGAIDANTQNIKITVRDTGIGISEHEQEHIFNEFAQADSTHSRKFEGTGLGLAIARSIVGAMGGDIIVSSTLNQGSSFSFTIPLSVPVSGLKDRDGYSLDDRVVVLSHSQVVRESLEYQLVAMGVKNIHVFAEAEGAIKLLKRHRNSVLLCDLNFAAQQGQKLTSLAEHSLVLLSPVARGRLEAFRRAGFHGYLIKPIRQVSLYERIRDKSAPQQKPQRLDAPVAESPQPEKRARILLAEDNQINAVLATAIIKRAGHMVDVAGNGVEALESVQTTPYDMIFMDMHMPEMDGMEATKAIRQLSGDVASIPIVALTANAMKTDRDICIEAGMNDFLTKPFEPEDLTGLIDRWAGLQKKEAEAIQSSPMATHTAQQG